MTVWTNTELKKVSSFIYNCRKCGMCGNKTSDTIPYVCPVKEHTAGFEHFYSRGRLVIAQGLLENQIIPSQELADIVYACSLCGNCTEQCGMTDPRTGLPLVDGARVIEAMRADLYRTHPEYLAKGYHRALSATRQYDNPWESPRLKKQKWPQGIKLKNAQKEPVDVLLFVGCTIPSNPLLVDRARKAAIILKQAGIEVGILGKNEPCCGSVQRRIGAVDLFHEMMERNIRFLNSLECDMIVTLCAGCYHTLKKDYASADEKLSPKVYHMVEYLSQLIKERKMAFAGKQSIRVAYHDPCHLGRHMKIFDPPRFVIENLSGVTLTERSSTKENTICCGAGGGMRLLAEGDLAEKIGKEALVSALDAGAEGLVTACPFCEINLETASQRYDIMLPVYDIVDLVSEAIKS